MDTARRPLLPRRGDRATARKEVRLAALALVALSVTTCAPVAPWRGLVKIGLVLPFHGPSPSAALDANTAIRQELIDRNNAGGIGGWRLELVSLDDESDPAVAAERVGELARDPDVVAVLAPPNGGEAPAAADRSLAFRPVTGAADAKPQLDQLLGDVANALAAGSAPRRGLREKLAGR